MYQMSLKKSGDNFQSTFSPLNRFFVLENLRWSGCRPWTGVDSPAVLYCRISRGIPDIHGGIPCGSFQNQDAGSEGARNHNKDHCMLLLMPLPNECAGGHIL